MTRSLQWILASLPRHGDRRAIGVRGDYGIRWTTYADLHQQALRLAHLFAERGLVPGERVLLWAANSPEWVACLLAAALRGLVVVPVDATAEKKEVEQMAQRTSARLLLVGDRQFPGGLAINAVALHRLSGTPPAGFETLRVPVAEHDPAVVLFTAGSSGEPRGVILTHGNIASQVAHFSYWTPVLRSIPTRLLALSPLSHVQGLMLGACVPLSLGLTVIYSRSIEPEHLQRCLRDAGVRVLCTVPRVLAVLQASLIAKGRERGLAGWKLRRKLLGPRFRVVLVGGATLPEAHEQFWRGLGCVVVQGYGSTETTAFVSVNRPLLGRRGSVGKMVHRGSMRLSEDGEILVRGPHLSPGYFGVDKAQDQTEDGYLRTGDLGKIDQRGRLFFLGRREDRIVTAEGHTLHPNTIETALCEMEGVEDAIVMPVSHDGLEQVHAVLIIAPDRAAAAVAEANAKLPEAARIRSWTVWPEPDFPRGALAKPRRAEIMAQTRRALESGDTPSGQPLPRREDTLESALQEPDRYRRLYRIQNVLLAQSDAPRDFGSLFERLRPLGMDSIDVAELTLLLRTHGASPIAPVPASANSAGPPPRAMVPQRNPLWQMWPGAQALREAVRTALFALPARRVHVVTCGTPLPAGSRPLLFALSIRDREHGVEFLAILRALPPRYRRRLIVTIGDGHLFESYFFRKPEDSAAWRWWVAFLVKFGVPSVLPYILAPGSTALGIGANCRAIDAGFSPLMTWSRFSATVACETGTPVVPLRMRGRRGDWSADMEIEFGAPIVPLSGITAAEFEQGVGQQLSGMGAKARALP